MKNTYDHGLGREWSTQEGVHRRFSLFWNDDRVFFMRLETIIEPNMEPYTIEVRLTQEAAEAVMHMLIEAFSEPERWKMRVAE